MFKLLKQRSFGALTLSQALGAFNDNAFKNLVLFIIAATAVGLGQEAGELSWITADKYLTSTLFSLPFVLFGAITGSMADRFSKSAIIKIANLMEIAVMGLAFLAFSIESNMLLMTTVFLMGTESALFGPSKYGSIIEMVDRDEISQANAMIQMTTMMAILVGVVVAGQFMDHFSGNLLIPGAFYLTFATLGWLASLRIKAIPACNPERRLSWNPVGEMWRHGKALAGQRPLILSVVASAFFYMVSATLMLAIIDYGTWLGLDGAGVGAFNAVVVVGIAIGAVVAAKISGKGIESGLIPIGLGGMGFTLLFMAFGPQPGPELTLWVPYACLFVTGVFTGIFTVPLRALIQVLPEAKKRGAVLGFSEALDFIGIMTGAGLLYVLREVVGLGPDQVFSAMGALVILFTIGSLFYTVEFAMRLFLLLLVHSVYRLRIQNKDNLPRTGGALIVCNHVSLIDALLVGAASPRPVRFMMFRDFFDVPFVGWFARRMGAIPVASGDDRRAKIESIRRAAQLAKDGELVCIFAEGAITRSGGMLPFARGLERIAKQAGVPVIPLALDRVWGSIFSFEGGRVFWKRPQRIPYPVDIIIGEHLPPETPAWKVRNHIQEMIADNRTLRKGARGSLAWRFVRCAKLNARQTAVVDSTGKKLNYRTLLIGCLAMRSHLDKKLDATTNVGVLLPPTAGGAIVNVALALMGRTSVNLNYTMGNDALQGPIEQAGLQQVITSRRFLKALDRPSPLPADQTLYLEDLAAGIGKLAKLRAALLSALPASILARLVSPQRSAQETATIIFSSGSTGDPKGVMLSHGNILSNVQGVVQILHVGPGDVLLGVLPFFHSFGYTVTIWGALLSGATAVYHSNPLEAKQIAKMCEEHGVTMTIGTPTLYQSWLRRFKPEQLSTLRIAMCGAEKLRMPLADAWREKFGKPLLEGYGATELSPVVSFNVPDITMSGENQVGNKTGTIGRPLPGVAVRVVDPDTGELLDQGQSGLLEVRGPNVMQGYLNQPELTAEVIRDGWYSTGDIAKLDREGFIAITDRLSRFSKIGGEMVPHGRVEEELQQCLAHIEQGDAENEEDDLVELAVTSLPDERKGEQLVVLHTPLPCSVEDLLAEAGKGELPPLFLPRAANFLEVTEIPKLGTGKTDLKNLRVLAQEALGVGDAF